MIKKISKMLINILYLYIPLYLALWEMWTSQSRVHRGVPVSTEVRRSPSPCLTIYWEMEEKTIF